jgi:hypothetical protein
MNHKEPEWTAENMNRKTGDTTFETCGWCEHASCGSCRHNCYLSISCSLSQSYGVGRDVFWDTPCIIKGLGKDDLKSNIESKQYEIKESEGCISRLKTQIAELERLIKKAVQSPPLPGNRPHDYYNIGDVLYVFQDNKWNRGICASGYRHHDGCVSYVLDDYPESKGGWGCGYCVPCVLKEWEYKYFKKDLLAFRSWLDLSDKKYNGDKLDLDSYYKAIGNKSHA